MNSSMLRIARKHFCRDYIPRSTQRHNMRAWVRSLRVLGNKWLLAESITIKPTK